MTECQLDFSRTCCYISFTATCTDVGPGPELDDSGIMDDDLDPKELEIQKLKAEIKCLKETAYNVRYK